MRRKLRVHAATLVALLTGISVAHAEEGMWTFDNFPFDKVEKAYGFRPTQAWLDHLRASSLRLSVGCSAAFVSAHGLVQTNNHCARDCVQQLSNSSRDYIATGFYAKEQKDEIKCPEIEADQLVGITDVTERIRKAIAGKENAGFADALRAAKTQIESACARNDATLRCDVVDLYNGGVYDLYKYRRYQDVRLVFAPELTIAFFGGDPDNFEFPRYNFDVSYLRVYMNGAPLDTKADYLPYARADVVPGDLVFTSGNPGSTNRLDTVAQLQMSRDITLPDWIFALAELRGILTEFSTEGPEQARIARVSLLEVENDLKAMKGEFSALVDGTIIKARMQSEKELRAKVDADPQLRRQYGGAWAGIAEASQRFRLIRDHYRYTEGAVGLDSTLFTFARGLMRHATEIKKPDQKRLPRYTEANLPALRQELLSKAPIYPVLEKLKLTFSLTRMREVLGPDDPIVKEVLGKESPAVRAAELVDATKLADPAERARLFAADPATLAASRDPMIVLARRLDPESRAMRKQYEDTIEAPQTKYSSQIAAARFKIYGTSVYPDATFTPRISYGTIKGYRVGAREIAPIATVAGLYARATGYDPFKLPQSWIAAEPRLDPKQPFNFATTNDIIGGNSGSPVVNRAGEMVGLIFDGNIQSLGGDYGYDPAVNRTVAVNVGILRIGLDKVYHAERIVKELAE